MVRKTTLGENSVYFINVVYEVVQPSSEVCSPTYGQNQNTNLAGITY